MSVEQLLERSVRSRRGGVERTCLLIGWDLEWMERELLLSRIFMRCLGVEEGAVG